MSKDQSQSPGEETFLEKLALRLLVFPGDPRVSKPRLFLGKIPENFPIDVPIPAESRVLGTLARSEAHSEIVLESDLKPDEVAAFYREHLTAHGWNEQEDEMRHHVGGFVHSGFGPHNHIVFCQSSTNAALTLRLMQLEGTATDIRLDITLSSESNPCNQQKRPRHRVHHSHRNLLPPLVPPAGAQQRGGGGGGGDTEWHSNATLKTDLPLDVLARHYSEQLRKGGWIQNGEGASGPLAWHTWKFTDEDQEPWHGLFFILQKPEKEGEYVLYARVEWDGPESNTHAFSWLAITKSTNSSTPLRDS